MIEVKIPSEIREYKSKLIFGLSVRQIISIGGAIIVGVLIGFFGKNHIPDDILGWAIMLAVVPFAGFGFFKFKDMKFEDFMKAFISMNFLPQRRVYEDSDMNLYLSVREEIIEKSTIEQRIDAGEYLNENAEWR